MVLKPFQQQRGAMMREGENISQDGCNDAVGDDIDNVDVVHDREYEGECRHKEGSGDELYEMPRNSLLPANECIR